ncbi:hypothetical protein B0T19DRAFT_454504, partial [Cercophora scortea]
RLRVVEEQRADAAQQCADATQQRADAAQQRADAEQRRANAAEQRRQRSGVERRRIAAARQCSEAARRRSEAARRRSKSLTSKGSISNPRDKLCPARLVPWSDFLEQQRNTFGILHRVLPTQDKAFNCLAFLRDLGKNISRKVANEKDLEYFQHRGVEDPLRSILEHLAIQDGTRDEFNIGNDVIFAGNTNAISEVAQEVVDRQAGVLDLNQLRVDQRCVYRRNDGDLSGRSMVYIIEYKAPHKLTPPQLRLGLREMDIYEEVVNRPTQPTAEYPDALFQYHADRLTAAAITQTFHYMIHSGLEHGLLTTGETIVFLKVDWANPGTLYYHLAEPAAEVLAHPANFRYCTAVGQLLAFSLMALGSPGETREHGQDERRSAIEGLKTWAVDYEAMLRSVSVDERKAPPSSPGYIPRTYTAVDRSPYPLRFGKKRAAEKDAPDVSVPRKDRSPEPSDDESEAQAPGTPSPTQPRSGGRGGQRGDHGEGSSSHPSGSGSQGRQYCTQKCFLGLVGGGLLDEKCPNVQLHRGRSSGARHRIDHSEWLLLLREQLERTLDDGVVRIWKQGARGVMFQVTLLTHGYTFVAKGTVSAFVDDLEHEAAVYRRLQSLQGVCVPVFLGAIDLRHISRTYYYDFRVEIIYMMFLSWAGESLDEAVTLHAMGGSPEQEVVRSVRALHAMGVAHTDVRKPNALWSWETRRVMVIDFERAVLMDLPRRPLAQPVPKKRSRTPEEMGFREAVGQLSSDEVERHRLRDDISAAKFMFYS